MMHNGRKLRFKKLVNLADIKDNERVLDLGCGKQQVLKSLIRSKNYIGIDKEGGDIQYDIEQGLPERIKREKFDAIFLNEVLEHIENFKSLLVECKDILTEKGRILISTPSNNRILYGDFLNGIGEMPHHIHCFRKTNVRNLARICGFDIIKISGTYIRFPPILSKWIAIPTNQSIYTEIIIYRLERSK